MNVTFIQIPYSSIQDFRESIYIFKGIIFSIYTNIFTLVYRHKVLDKVLKKKYDTMSLFLNIEKKKEAIQKSPPQMSQDPPAKNNQDSHVSNTSRLQTRTEGR